MDYAEQQKLDRRVLEAMRDVALPVSRAQLLAALQDDPRILQVLEGVPRAGISELIRESLRRLKNPE